MPVLNQTYPSYLFGESDDFFFYPQKTRSALLFDSTESPEFMMRLFNSNTRIMYEAELLQTFSENGSDEIILKVSRAQLSRDDFEFCIMQTGRARVSYTPPEESTVLAHFLDILQANGCAGHVDYATPVTWRIYVLQSNPWLNPPFEWVLSTSPVNSGEEQLPFERKELEEIFIAAQTDILYLCLRPLPFQEKIDSPYCTEGCHQNAVTNCIETLDATDQSQAPCDGPWPSHPLLLLWGLDEVHEPSHTVVDGRKFFFALQMHHWQRQQQYFQAKIDNLPPQLVLRAVQKTLQFMSEQKLEEWDGLWMLSLLELECDATIDVVGYLAALSVLHGTDQQGAGETFEDLLSRCVAVARQITRLVDRLLRMTVREKYRMVLGVLSLSLLTILLHVLRLRAVRHLSFATRALQKLNDLRQSSLPCQKRLEQEALRSGQVVAALLHRLKPDSLKWLPLAPTLLMGGLCMLEIVAHFSPSSKCGTRLQLVGLALVLFKVWQRITQDPRIAPHCAADLFTQICAESLQTDDAVRAIAMEDILVSTEKQYLTVETELSFDLAELAEYPPYISLVVRWLWSMAAVDQAYQRAERQCQYINKCANHQPVAFK